MESSKKKENAASIIELCCLSALPGLDPAENLLVLGTVGLLLKLDKAKSMTKGSEKVMHFEPLHSMHSLSRIAPALIARFRLPRHHRRQSRYARASNVSSNGVPKQIDHAGRTDKFRDVVFNNAIQRQAESRGVELNRWREGWDVYVYDYPHGYA